MLNDLTLQINISPGDVAYAAITVPEILRKHKLIKNRLLIVDCCRPQKTKLVDPDKRFPTEVFNKRVEQLLAIVESFRKDELFSEIYCLYPNDPIIDHLSKKYLRGLSRGTHAGGGTANMSYWLGIELVKTRYMLHLDADMILYSKQGYEWYVEALEYFKNDENIASAVPRLCPPSIKKEFINAPSEHEGVPSIDKEHYWENSWFSTRQFLLDRQRLSRYFPLVNGRMLLEFLVRKYSYRVFPRDPEIVLGYGISSRGGKRIVLKNKDAFYLHPVTKTDAFVNNLPAIIDFVNRNQIPQSQFGKEDIDLEGWLKFINE